MQMVLSLYTDVTVEMRRVRRVWLLRAAWSLSVCVCVCV